VDRGEFIVEHCPACGLHVPPPRGICRNCHNRTLEWVPVDGPATVYSFTANANEWVPGAGADYVVVLAEYPQYSGIRFLGFWLDPASEPVIGQQVVHAFAAGPGGFQRIAFVPVGQEA
jgi:uncharacterized OB-fold protein